MMRIVRRGWLFEEGGKGVEFDDIRIAKTPRGSISNLQNLGFFWR